MTPDRTALIAWVKAQAAIYAEFALTDFHGDQEEQRQKVKVYNAIAALLEADGKPTTFADGRDARCQCEIYQTCQWCSSEEPSR